MNFEYKEHDEAGLETLDALSEADKFNRWMYETIAPYCQGQILEVGSGIGNISKFFLDAGKSLSLSDIRENYCLMLKKRFSGYSNIKNILNLDLVDPRFDEVHGSHFGSFDTIFALNVVEHIEDDQQAIKNCYKLLKSSGKLVILVPAFNFLYNDMDKELYHFRRYNKKKLKELFLKAGFKIQKGFYFNLMGMFGWYVSGNLLGNRTIPKSQLSIYNFCVPAFRLIDKILFNRVGLSVIVIGIK